LLQEFSHPVTVGRSLPAQVARQSLLPQVSTVVLSQALLAVPQVKVHGPPAVQSTTRLPHAWTAAQETTQPYSLLQVRRAAWHDFWPAQLSEHGIPAGHSIIKLEQSFCAQSILQIPPSQLLQAAGQTAT
jgi:hypothetical protein